MHDLKFAAEIISSIKNKLQKTSGRSQKNITVDVRLSPLTHVTPKGLSETFKQLAEHEGLTNVKLNIGVLEFEMHCRTCKAITKGTKPIFLCPQCKSSDFDIEREKEFVIDSVGL